MDNPPSKTQKPNPNRNRYRKRPSKAPVQNKTTKAPVRNRTRQAPNQDDSKHKQRIEKIERIETIDDLNNEAKEFESFVKIVCGIKLEGLSLDASKKKPGPNSQKLRLVDDKNKNQIRGLFRSKYLRAMQEVLFGPTFYCTISADKIERHYASLLTTKPECKISELPPILWKNDGPSMRSNSTLTKDFQPRQVSNKLKNRMCNRFYNTRSPGMDKIHYADLFTSDEDCLIMSALFNACLRVHAIPKIWVENYSVLVKDNDKSDDDIKNWRLVTMNSTISKIFQNMIAARLIVWAKQTNVLSATQKGYLLTNAACESSFILQECKNYAKENDKDLAVAWLDFSNASNYIPQDSVTTCLAKHGVPEEITGIIVSWLQNSTTKIKVMEEKGFTNPIPIRKGLPLGSPLSPILLDLVNEPILRSLNADNNKFEIFNQKINHFAIPNELTLVAESPIGLQNLLDSVERTSKLVGLHFNVNKCRSYHYDSKKNCSAANSKFFFCGQKLENVPDEEVTEYFGVKQGLSIGHDGIPTIDEMFDSLNAIDASLLDGFQKTTSILTYIIPRVENYLRGLDIDDKQSLELVDTVLRTKLISWLDLLPGATPASIVYNVLNLKRRDEPVYLPFVDLFHIMKIVQAFKMLTSQDEIVKRIAFDSLTAEVEKVILKQQGPPTRKQLAQYLSGQLNIKNVQSKSMWPLVREATLQLKMKIGISWEYNNAMKIKLVSKKSPQMTRKKSTTNEEQQIKNMLVQYYVQEIKERSSGVKEPELKKK